MIHLIYFSGEHAPVQIDTINADSLDHAFALALERHPDIQSVSDLWLAQLRHDGKTDRRVAFYNVYAFDPDDALWTRVEQVTTLPKGKWETRAVGEVYVGEDGHEYVAELHEMTMQES
ncbi:MAG: hypothetical protein HY731_04115 [Candidatus Tectomicrobia bacterium]|nr:hypothetical protein [Candidatus Tectomicrobia bacterium]